MLDCRAIYSADGLHRREQKHIADRRAVCQQHHETVNADTESAGRRHTVLERRQKVLVDIVGLIVARSLERGLMLKAAALIDWVVQFAERVRVLTPKDKQFEPLRILRLLRLTFGQRRDIDWMIGDKNRLDQMLLTILLKEQAENIALSMALFIFNVMFLCNGTRLFPASQSVRSQRRCIF